MFENSANAQIVEIKIKINIRNRNGRFWKWQCFDCGFLEIWE